MSEARLAPTPQRLFDDLIAERTHDFVGREWVFAAIDAWLADEQGPPFFIITGEPGIGKTAIAARATQRYDAAAHFCIARQADTIEPSAFVRRLSHALCEVPGFAAHLLREEGVTAHAEITAESISGTAIGIKIENLTLNARSAAAAFEQTVAQPLRALFADGYTEPILIVVDALDEAAQHQGSETIVSLLANRGKLPPQVRWLVTARPEGEVLRHFAERNSSRLLLDAGRPENIADARAYIHHRLQADDELRARVPQAQQGTFITQLADASDGNSLYLTWLLRAVARGDIAPDAPTFPSGLDGVYRGFLRTRQMGIDLRRWRQIFRLLLGILAVAQAPLETVQLAAISGLNLHDLDDALRDLGQFLNPSLAAQERYQLYHQSVTDFLFDKQRADEFWVDRRAAHKHIADYCAMVIEKGFGHSDGHYTSTSSRSRRRKTIKPVTDHANQQGHRDYYAIYYYIKHLAALNQWNEVCNIAVRVEWSKEKYYQPWSEFRRREEGHYAGYLADIGIAWQWADNQHNLALSLRCALISSSIRSLSSNMSPELLGQLVTVGTSRGCWTPTAAIEYIAYMTDPDWQAAAIVEITKSGVPIPWKRAIEVAHSINRADARTAAFFALIQHINTESEADEYTSALSAALQSSSAIYDPIDRFRIIVKLIPHLSLPQHSIAASIAITSLRHYGFEHGKIDALLDILPILDEKTLIEAMKAVGVLSHDNTYVDLSDLERIAAHATPRLLPVFIEIVANIDIEVWRARFIVVLARAIEPKLAEQILELVFTIENKSLRLGILLALAPSLTNLQPIVRKVAFASKWRQWPHGDTSAIDRYLPTDLESVKSEDVLFSAIKLYGRIYSDMEEYKLVNFVQDVPELLAAALNLRPRVCSLARVARELGQQLPLELIPMMLEEVHAEEDGFDRAIAFAILALRLPSEQQRHIQDIALRSARTLGSAIGRCWALIEISSYIPSIEQYKVLDDALSTASSIENTVDRCDVLSRIAPHLLASQRQIAIERAIHTLSEIENGWPRANALTNLVHRTEIQTELLPTIISIATNIDNSSARDRALRELAPHLPLNLQPAALDKNMLEIDVAMVDHAVDQCWFIGDEDELHDFLADLKLLSTDTVSETLNGESDTEDEHSQLATTLASLPQLPTDELPALFDAILDRPDKSDRVEKLLTLVPYLTPDLIPTALEVISAFDNEEDRVRAIVAIAPRLPPALVPVALQVAIQVTDYDNRGRAIVGLAPFLTLDLLPVASDLMLTPSMRFGLVEAFLSILSRTSLLAVLRHIAHLEHVQQRDDALRALIQYLPERPWPPELQFVTASEIELWSVYDFELVPYLTDDLLPLAFEIACSIRHRDHRTEALVLLAPYLTTDLQRAALNTVSTLELDSLRARLLAALAPTLPPPLRSDAFHIASTLEERSLTHAVVALAPYVPHELVLAALEIATALSEGDNQGRIIASLAPRLSSELLRVAMSQALTIGNAWGRAHALVAIGQQKALSLELLSDVFSGIIAITDNRERVSALIKLFTRAQEHDMLANMLGLKMRLSHLVFESISSIDSRDMLSSAIDELEPLLMASQHPLLIDCVLKVNSRVSNPHDRAHDLLLLAAEFPTLQQTVIFQNILDTINECLVIDVELVEKTIGIILATSELDPTSMSDDDVARVLAQYAPQLARMLRTLAQKTRPVLLNVLRSLLPILLLATQKHRDVAMHEYLSRAVVEIGECWP